MNFSADLLPHTWLWGGHLVYALLLGWALLTVHWHQLKTPSDAHVFFASCIVLWLIWRMSGGAMVGMEFHLLLVTTITLMFGWQFSVLCVSIAQLGLTLEGQTEWASYGLNVLCNGIVPVWVTYWVFRYTYTWLPRNIFVYIFGCGFAGGALSMLFSRFTGMAILVLSGAYQWENLGEEPMFVIIMLFPEAFLNGMLITIFVVYRPQWVSSFVDQHYLSNSKSESD